ncbi:hypothetical protein [Algisphaera agarilytica]|uniref:Uncharacterized protein n=1 Tax=Algisphaera agarilytica TaxID=1385975 RepID=A0A7X0H3M0_9BACT|nr:hypothetical protein [Algisphaera agarilytica]MBB6428663.1 hypothetical protein [Algisphaera agarilytica]
MSAMFRKMMGEDPEVARFRVWLGVFVVWCATGLMSCGEIKYLRSGETAVAERVNASDGRAGQRPYGTYRWRDAESGEYRNKVIEFSRSVMPPRSCESSTSRAGPTRAPRASRCGSCRWSSWA